MTDHREGQIYDAVIAAIGNDTAAGSNVYYTIGHIIPDSVDCSITLVVGEDGPPENAGPTFLDSWLDFELLIAVKGSDPSDLSSGAKPSYITELSTLRKQIHTKLMSDKKLGLSFVIDTTPNGAYEPTIDGVGAKVVVTRRLRWRIKYRSNLNDPS